MSNNPDRLYDLVPVIYRLRDAEQGYGLRALLRVMAEQYDVLEADIARLYENWFIETCDEWVVPYIGGVIGYEPLLGPAATAKGGTRVKGAWLASPRREVAATITNRRRKGTLAVVEDVARQVSGWPVKAVEFYRLLAFNRNLNCQHKNRGRTGELRDSDALRALGGPFDEMARNVDIRRTISLHARGSGNIPEVGLYVWRLKSYGVTQTPATCYEAEAPNCYLFSPLGNDTVLFNNPASNTAMQAEDLSLPLPISRYDFESRDSDDDSGRTVSGIPFYYGDGRSLMIWTGAKREPVPSDQIVAADLSAWGVRPLPGQVAVDPERGRIMFPPGGSRRQNVYVSYSYGFSADIGGGEYERPIRGPADAVLYQVGKDAPFAKITDALARWTSEAPQDAVIEITDSGVYTEPLQIVLAQGQTLQLRAANRTRPILNMLDWRTSAPDSLSISGAGACWFILDGLIVTGRGVEVSGEVSGLAIRHATLVPGWGLDCDCTPQKPSEPSLQLIEAPRCVNIEHSIIGAIHIERNQTRLEPVQIRIADSIVDATSSDGVALGTTGQLCAHAALVIRRSTVIGQVQAHAIELAENCLFLGEVRACKRQQGCVRFCYLPPTSRTPRRFECQPDMVLKAVTDSYAAGAITAEERDSLLDSEALRVRPEFVSLRYSNAAYCQLGLATAAEIVRGADDESEMGVFHDLFEPQRAANLRTRLAEYTPAGINAGVIFEN